MLRCLQDKNAHKAQQVSARHAMEQIRTVEEQLAEHRNAAEQFVSAELKGIWLAMEEMRTASFEALAEATAAMRSVDERAQQSQDDSHLRIMMYQLSANDYVPARSRIDVAGRLREQLRGATDTCVRAFELPEVELDWTLVWYGLENALSNARKYGTTAGGQTQIEFALEYHEPMLLVQVTNAVDPAKQAELIAKYGTDATQLLQRRVEGGGSQSTNLGGQAVRDVARLLGGSVALHLEPTRTRFCLRVRAPRPVEVEVSEALLVFFIDDAPTMRMVYQMWISEQASPLDPGCRVFPPSGLDPAATDEAMRAFHLDVLSARPRPRAVVLDQHLASQVARREDATTGTEIARKLRNGGYRGTIIIRSANISVQATQEYLTAGADAVLSKDDTRDKLVQLIVEGRTAAQPVSADVTAIDAPLIADDVMWASAAAPVRDAILAEFRRDAVRSLDELDGLLEQNEVGSLPRELHNLLGHCRAVGARRMQLAAGACKAGLGRAQLAQLEELLGQTFAALDERCGGGTVDASTRAQMERAARMTAAAAAALADATTEAAAQAEEVQLVYWRRAQAVAPLVEMVGAEMERHVGQLRAALATG